MDVVSSRHCSSFSLTGSQHGRVWKGPQETTLDGTSGGHLVPPLCSSRARCLGQGRAPEGCCSCPHLGPQGMPRASDGGWGIRRWHLAYRCMFIQVLCHPVKELHEVSKLCSTGDYEKERDWIFSETPQLQQRIETEMDQGSRVGGCRFLHL